MKIAYLAGTYPRASDTYVREEVAALRRRGHEVSTFAMRPPGDAEVESSGTHDERRATRYLVPGYRDDAAEVLRGVLGRPTRLLRAVAAARRLGSPGVRGRLWPWLHLAEAARLARHLRQDGATHVHAHTSEGPAAVAMLAATLTGGTWSMTVHGPYELDRAPQLQLDLKAASAAFVVAISEYTRGQVYRWVRPEHWSKVHVVRCGVAPQFLTTGHSSAPARRTLVCVGRLAPEKGQRLLVRAARQVLDGGAAPFYVRLVGDGPDREDLEALVAELRLQDVVHLEGWRSAEEIGAALRGSRAMVLPSLAEGLPIALMESLAAHRPAVVSAVAGVPELLRDGENGWLVPAGDAASLAEALRRVLDLGADDLARMGAAGSADVRRLHDVDRSAAQLEALFTAAG